MATVGLSDKNYKGLKELARETGKPIQTLADYFVGQALEKAVVKEVRITKKEIVME